MNLFQHISDVFLGKATVFHPRSNHWPTVRKHYLEKFPTCAACGGKLNIEVHHMQPFHLHPELELDETNFITLCETPKEGDHCHLHFGHLGNWKNFNPNVIPDAAAYLKSTQSGSLS